MPQGDTTPAIAGGRPVRPELLPFARPSLNVKDTAMVQQALQGDLVVQPWLDMLEEKLAAYTGRRYAVAVASGTAALHLALAAAAIGPQEEVVLSPLAPPAAANAVLYMGAVPIFADVDPRTLTMDPAAVEQVLTERSKAVIAFHYAGRPCDMDAIAELAARRNLTLIEDATQALGATYNGHPAGSFGEISCLGFHHRQGVCTGEGGAVVTDRADLADWLRLFRNLGLVEDPAGLVANEGPWHREMQDLGFSYRLGPLEAALGASQMERAGDFLSRRGAIAARYDEAFRDEPLILPPRTPATGDAHYLYPVRLVASRLKAGRREIFEAVRAENISLDVHYLPVFRHPYQRWIGHPEFCALENPFVHTEEAYANLISLPIYPAMQEEDVDAVIQAVKKVLAYYAGG
ncbi:MAG TPA: DegT/DnrJ/EryC1/StrS family aminotransferase [Spirochaetia bacterium]|nr:DegT/DnrJ/EryC1/StrS family aminotransferase [Spirochaetia bacterium]